MRQADRSGAEFANGTIDISPSVNMPPNEHTSAADVLFDGTIPDAGDPANSDLLSA